MALLSTSDGSSGLPARVEKISEPELYGARWASTSAMTGARHSFIGCQQRIYPVAQPLQCDFEPVTVADGRDGGSRSERDLSARLGRYGDIVQPETSGSAISGMSSSVDLCKYNTKFSSYRTTKGTGVVMWAIL